MFGWNEAELYSFSISLAVKSTAVLGIACIAARLLKRRSAAERHLVWTAAAAVVAVLPFLSVSLPAMRVTGPAALVADMVVSATAGSIANDPADAIPARRVQHSAITGRTHSRLNWRIWVMLLWAMGSIAAFTQMLFACSAMWRIRRRARPCGEHDLYASLSRALGICRPVQVLETERGSMPITFGVWRSVVFLPSDASVWSEERRRIVLLHELAHVRRKDVATHLLARTTLILHWWNPLAWIAWREFLKERERAADDLVLNAGERASAYAGHLLAVARAMQSSPAMACAGVAMARRSQLEGRLLAILDSGVNRRTPARASVFAGLLLALGVVAPLAAVRAQVPAPEAQALSDEVDGTIRAAVAQKNYQMLESAAVSAERLRKYDITEKLLQAAAEIRAKVSGETSGEYGVALLKLADVEQKQHRKKAAQDHYAQAAQILGEQPAAARALIYLGVSALVNKDFPHAMEYFERAQRVDPSHAGAALMWMAVVRQTEQNPEEADALYRRALSAKSPESTTAMRLYAQFLTLQGRTEEANEFHRQIRALQVQGPPATEHTYKVSSPGITGPSLLSKIEPEYTDEARAAKLQGTEIVSVEIGPDGVARNPQVLQGLGLGLDENGIDAINQWVFKPGTKDGQPVTVLATIEINWRLM